MKKTVAALAMVLGTGWMTYSFLPGLIADARTSDWVPAFELEVDKAECTVHWHVLSTCEIKYHDREQSEAAAGSIEHLVYGSWGEERFMLMRSASHPEVVTSTLGIRDLAARLVTMALWIVVVLAIAAAFVRSLFTGSDDARADVAVAMPAPQPALRTAGASNAVRTGFGRRSART